VGETRELALSDGTAIRLDAGSTLSARIGWGARRVTLGEGEASFDVARDSRRPFLIAVGDQTVRVVGTEFNIRHYDGATTVTVRRGVVEVYQGQGAVAPAARLTKGWALTHQQGQAASRLTRVDPNMAFAWTQGLLICDDQPLPEIVAYLNRRLPVPIRLSGDAARRRFSGVLQLSDPLQVTRDLARYLSLSEVRSERQIVLR
jgi:transmembrane sensor